VSSNDTGRSPAALTPVPLSQRERVQPVPYHEL
jgi:hypothetical protein